MAQLLDEIATTSRDVATRVGASVVSIGADHRGNGVVTSTNIVVTNAHNLRGAETSVTFGDGRRETANLAGADIDGDLAVLAVSTADTPTIDWAAQRVELGSPIFAVSRTAVGGTRVTFGLVSAADQAFRGPRGRRISGALEHTAPLARGSSGGPIVDADGRLVGVNTHRLRGGFYLAQPADEALRERVSSLGEGKAPTQRRLGVGLAPASVARRLRRSVGLPERDGLLVRVVEADSPADAAGVREGDLIVSAAGRELATIDDLHEVLDGPGGGDELVLQVVRGTEELTVTARFATG